MVEGLRSGPSCRRVAAWSLVVLAASPLFAGERPLPVVQDPASAEKAAAEARPWTLEEMAAARPLDVGVTPDMLARWADPEAGKAYDTTSGPGFEPGGAADGDRRLRAEPGPVAAATAGRVDPVGETKGYSYPAPFTRYQVFPNVTGFPHRAVGKVFFKQGGSSYVCSASSIGGDAVITAAHCVIDGATGEWSTAWTFVPAYSNKGGPYGQWTADHLWYINNWVNGSSGDFRFDVGGAVLKRKGSKKISQAVGWLGFAWNQDNNDAGAHFTALGYPAASPFNGKYQYACQGGWAYGHGAYGNPSPFGIGCDQTGGSSGGPWLRNYSGSGGASNYVAGVNSFKRCQDAACTVVFTHEMNSPYFDDTVKALKDCLVNSVPGNPADPARGCAPGT